jgi:acetolactate synthase-1/2/3 large subunit
MADGYARETGKIGVCCATTGPGATNLITGVAGAYADHVPMLAITPQTPLPTFGLGPFQESSADAIDIVGMFAHCTRYNSLVSHPDQLEKKLAAALTVAMQTPRGPAHLSIPADFLRVRLEKGSQMAFPNLAALAAAGSSVIDSAAVEKLSGDLQSALSQGRRIVLLVGHDCAGAADEITQFAELIEAPIVTTPRGKSRINPYHPLARGVFGFAGHAGAREALADPSVGLILAAGTEFGDWGTSGWDPVLMNDKLVHIHNAIDYFSRSPMARLHVFGNICEIFKRLAERMQPIVKTGKKLWTDAHAKYLPKQIKVQASELCEMENAGALLKAPHVIRELIQRFPAETRFLIDNSNSVPWSIHYFFNRNPENYHLSVGFASMGWAIGAAVGMALGAKDKPVICVTGDGCFLMNGLEITTAVEQKAPVIFAVLVDRAYGMIKHSIRRTSDERIELAIPHIDFCAMAKSSGAEAFSILNSKDFDRIDYSAICSRQGPTLLEIFIDPEEIPPLRMS